MMYLELFWVFAQVGLFSFGGGYASLPLIQEQIVNIKNWMTVEEFNNILTISQLTPGPIALNTSTFVGTKVLGIPGAIMATLGCVTPSLIIVVLLAFIYFKFSNLRVIQGMLAGLRPAVIALIASAGLSIVMSSIFQASDPLNFTMTKIDYVAAVLFVPAVIVLLKFRLNPVLVMLGCGAVGGTVYLLL